MESILCKGLWVVDFPSILKCLYFMKIVHNKMSLDITGEKMDYLLNDGLKLDPYIILF